MLGRALHRAFLDRTTYLLGAVLVTLVFLYTYFVIGTIIEVVLREELEIAIKDKHSTMASLEAAYLKAEEGVTLDFAEKLEFYPLEKEEYLTRSELSRVTTESR